MQNSSTIAHLVFEIWRFQYMYFRRKPNFWLTKFEAIYLLLQIIISKLKCPLSWNLVYKLSLCSSFIFCWKNLYIYFIFHFMESQKGKKTMKFKPSLQDWITMWTVKIRFQNDIPHKYMFQSATTTKSSFGSHFLVGEIWFSIMAIFVK